MLKVIVEVQGNKASDLEAGLEEALCKVREGYLCGSDANDTGQYRFDVTGEAEEEEDE